MTANNKVVTLFPKNGLAFTDGGCGGGGSSAFEAPPLSFEDGILVAADAAMAETDNFFYLSSRL